MMSVITIAPGLRIVSKSDTRGMTNPVPSVNCKTAAEMIRKIKKEKDLSGINMVALWQHLDGCEECTANFASTLSDLGFNPGFGINFGPGDGNQDRSQTFH